MNTRLRLIAIITSGALATTGVVAASPSARARNINGPAVTSASQLEKVLGQPGAPNLYVARVVKQINAKPLSERRNQVIDVILETAAGGMLVEIIKKAAEVDGKEVFRMVKNAIFKVVGGKGELIPNAGDGECLASWGRNIYSIQSPCSRPHAIFWEYNTNGEGHLWNTYTKGDLISYTDRSGSHTTTTWPRRDWYTWTWGYICANQSCSQVYGVYWTLYNHQSEDLSDTAPGS